MTPEAQSAARRREALDHALGAAVLQALEAPDVVEVLANPDGRLVLDRQGSGRADTGLRLEAAARERVIRLVADFVGEPVTREDPRLSGVLPGGERFQGFLPPVCAGPAFSIRKRPTVVWTLEDYVAQQVLTPGQAAVLRGAVAGRRNILISGGAGSGKTTLANALLAEPAFAGDRVFLIEDTPELQCSAWDLVAVLTRRHPKVIGVADLVRDALRMRPDRIVVGEMRDGAAALETLKAWNTGHPGGSARCMPTPRSRRCSGSTTSLGEVLAKPARRMVARAVDLVLHLSRRPQGRVLEPIVVLEGLAADGGYALRADL